MSTKPGMSDIAVDRELWGQYVDPNNNDPEAFDRMTVAEKIALQRDLWPDEADITAEQAIKILASKTDDLDVRYEAVVTLAGAVLDMSEYGDPDSSLEDWIGAGDYTGSETVESIAAEWDERDE